MFQRLAGAVSIAIAIASAVVAVPLAAQSVPDRDAAVEYRTQFMTDLDSLNAKVVALANAIPADKYAWRPMPGVRSFGEVFMHIASEYYVYNPLSFRAARSPIIPRAQDAMKNFEANSSKDSVLKYLADGFAYGHSAINAVAPDSLAGKHLMFGQNLNIIETGTGMTADLHEHLGQLIAYARMNGIVPPWSK